MGTTSRSPKAPPGRSPKKLRSETNKINLLISSGEYIVVSVNFASVDIRLDFVFISNMKGFKGIKEMPTTCGIKTVATSNIVRSSNDFLIVNHSRYLNEDTSIIDNVGMMCINLLIQIGV